MNQEVKCVSILMLASLRLSALCTSLQFIVANGNLKEVVPSARNKSSAIDKVARDELLTLEHA